MKVTSLLFLSTVAVASSFTVDAVREVGKGGGVVEGLEQVGKKLSGKADEVGMAANPNTIKGLFENNPDLQKAVKEHPHAIKKANNKAASNKISTSEDVPSNGQPTITRTASDASNNQPFALKSIPTDPKAVQKDLDIMVRETDAYKHATPEQQKLINERQKKMHSSFLKMTPEELAKTMAGYKNYQLVLMALAAWVVAAAPGVAIITGAGIGISRAVKRKQAREENRTAEIQQEQEQREAAEMKQGVDLFEKDEEQ